MTYQFILRNYSKRKGKVLATVFNAECLLDTLRKIQEKVKTNDENDFIDLERNGKIVATAYALSGDGFTELEYYTMEYYCKYGSK